jgi:hypothetical protein
MASRIVHLTIARTQSAFKPFLGWNPRRRNGHTLTATIYVNENLTFPIFGEGGARALATRVDYVQNRFFHE